MLVNTLTLATLPMYSVISTEIHFESNLSDPDDLWPLPQEVVRAAVAARAACFYSLAYLSLHGTGHDCPRSTWPERTVTPRSSPVSTQKHWYWQAISKLSHRYSADIVRLLAWIRSMLLLPVVSTSVYKHNAVMPYHVETALVTVVCANDEAVCSSTAV